VVNSVTCGVLFYGFCTTGYFSLRSVSGVTKLLPLLRPESRVVKPEIASREDGKLYLLSKQETMRVV
jgi:hypothetical protein